MNCFIVKQTSVVDENVKSRSKLFMIEEYNILLYISSESCLFYFFCLFLFLFQHYVSSLSSKSIFLFAYACFISTSFLICLFYLFCFHFNLTNYVGSIGSSLSFLDSKYFIKKVNTKQYKIRNL